MVLTDIQKYEIVIKYNSGSSIMQIANDMKINKNTVCLWLSRHKDEGNLKRKRGSGIHKRKNDGGQQNK